MMMRVFGTRSATFATTRGRAARRRGGVVRVEGGDVSVWKLMVVMKLNLVNNLDGKMM